VFANFGAELPAPTLLVIAISDAFVAYWYLIFGALIAAIVAIAWSYKRSNGDADRGRPAGAAHFRWSARSSARRRWRAGRARCRPCSPPACRWSRRSIRWAAPRATMSMLVATRADPGRGQHRHQPHGRDAERRGVPDHGGADGVDRRGIRPARRDAGKVADFFEQEVDDAVAGLSQLLEPLIMVFLGTVIGGLVVAMYLPIFKLGAIV
jgi:type IV pilus assembly protein PilC